MPRGVAIYADIEGGWQPSTAWIEGWSDAMFGSQYAGAGGFYANTAPLQPAYFNDAYCAAFSADDNMRVSVGLIYANEPEPGCTTASNAPAFAPDAPDCNYGAAVLWQYAEECYAVPNSNQLGAFDEDIANATGWYYLW